MTFQVSPGVNISEIDLTTVVPAISTTQAGFAGHFRWGPVEQRVLVTSENELVQTYLAPDANTASDFFTAANFLAYGNQLYVTRVVATATNPAYNAHGNSANATGTIIKNEDDYLENFASGITGVGDFAAKYPGEIGNSLKVSVCPSSSAWESTLTGTINAVSGNTGVTGSGTDFINEVVAGDILVVGPSKESVKVLSVTNATSIILESSYGGNTVVGATIDRRWEYFGNFDTAPGTSDQATGAGGSADELHIVVVDEDGKFSGTRGTVLEKFEKVSFASDAVTADGTNNYYKNVINGRSSYVWWVAHNSGNSSAGSKASTTFVGDTTPQTVSLSRGIDGQLPTAGEYIEGYNLFASAEDVDVSVILGGASSSTVATHLINNIAENRKDCIVVLSPERADVVNNNGYPGSEVDDVVAFRNSLPSTSYATMDCNWKYQYDKYNDVYRYVPCNGDTGGLIVRTDLSRDPWWSPAGFNRGGMKNVVKLAFNPNKAERDVLYKNGVNPVVTFPGQGTVLFGDKTLLSKPSAFDRINVRRLFIVLEKAIATAAKFTLFEFNDDFTRAQFRNLVEPFLRDVQGRRGIFDYRVVCDATNNTPEVIDRNEFVGSIFVKPARSINFIQLNFVGVRSGVEFSEIVGSV